MHYLLHYQAICKRPLTAWLADVLARLPGHPTKRIAELLPWNWPTAAAATEAAV